MVERLGLVEKLLALRSVPVFGGFPDEELVLLASTAQVKRFAAGEKLLARGERVQWIIVPVRGELTISRGSVLVGADELSAGVGLLSMLSEQASNLEVFASTAVVVMSIRRTALSDALEDDFQMSLRLLSRLSSDLVAEFRSGDADRTIPAQDLGSPPTGGQGGQLDLVERLLVLRPSQVFRTASLDGMAQFAKMMRSVRYERGEVLWREGVPATGMLVIVEGHVACDHRASSAVTRYGPYGLLGAIDVLSGEKTWATARCSTEVRGLWVGREELLDVLEDNFELTVNLLKFIAYRTLDLRSTRQP